MSAFLALAGIHLLAVMSPGPDFALIVQKSLTRNRSASYWTALGLATGISLHVTYCLLGIGLVISRSIILFSVIKWCGALYLIYIGWKSLKARPLSRADVHMETKTESFWTSYREGLLCNALNPKVTIFFLALFTQVIDASTPLLVQAGYGYYMALQTFLWFSFLGWALSGEALRMKVRASQHWIERVMGAALIALGIRLALVSKE